MLKLSGSMFDQPVLSLRTGGPIAIARTPIINPNNLKIVGFYCQERGHSKEFSILLVQDIREWIAQGFAVNDHEVLSLPDDLIRLKPIMDIKFELIGKPVYTKQHKRVGKVNDFATDTLSFTIQKLYVSQNIFKSLSGTGLSIDRSQIIEITDKRVLIQDPLQGVPQTALSNASV